MTTKSRRRDRAVRQTRRGQFTSDRPTPPATSWWMGVPRAQWRAAVAAYERRWRRTETTTPTPGV